jgi:dTDP-glucose 4,6-dehydratase
MVLRALEGKSLPIYGDGKNIRDWLFVEDHCEGLLQVLQNGVPGEKYNLGGQSECSNVEVVEAICRILDELFPCARNPVLLERGIAQYGDLKTFVSDRPGHDFRYGIDPTKIQAKLGWQPRHTFESGLRRTIQWYVDNRQWCEVVTRQSYEGERLGLSDAEIH